MTCDLIIYYDNFAEACTAAGLGAEFMCLAWNPINQFINLVLQLGITRNPKIGFILWDY